MPDSATFYLDEPAAGDPSGSWPARRNARTWRFTLLAGGGQFTTGGATAFLYGAGSVGWTLLLAAGLLMFAVGIYRWVRRPFLRLADGGLSFRLEPRGSTHAIRRGEVNRLDLEPEAVQLHREDQPAMHLRFDTLREDRGHQLRTHLADTARRHGVSASER
jgi:hypothetical protein